MKNIYYGSVCVFLLFFVAIFYGCAAETSGGTPIGPTPGATLQSITVSPESVSLTIGQTQQFTATGNYSDGSKFAVTVLWSSTNTSVGTVNSLSGLFTAVAQGTVNVKAQTGNHIDTASIVVNSPGANPPSTPTNLSTTNIDNHSVTFSWSSVANATGYIVSYGSDSSATNIGTKSATSNSTTLGSLDWGSTYYAKVLAYNSNNEKSSYSSIKTFVTTAEWDSPESVATLDLAETYNAIVIDENKKAHIVYLYNNDLTLKTNENGLWVGTVIHNDTPLNAGYISMARTSHGIFYVITYEPTINHFYYVTNATGSWVQGLFDNTEIYADNYTNDIVVDVNNNLYISYAANGGFVRGKFIKKIDGLPWEPTETLDPTSIYDYGRYNSLALDSGEKVHIACYDDAGKLRYYNNIGGSWTGEIVDGSNDVGGGNSIAVDSSDLIHICYNDITNSDLKYVTGEAGGPWIATILDENHSGNGKIIIDEHDNVYIVYYDSYNGALKFISNKSGNWLKYIIDDNMVLPFFSLTKDQENNLYISYAVAGIGSATLKYAKLD